MSHELKKNGGPSRRSRVLGVTSILAIAACVALLVLGGWSRAGAADTAGQTQTCAAAACPAAAAGVVDHGGRQLNPMMLLLFAFLIAVFLGVELISKVPSQLHTPLMSGSNAISGITIVGALIAAGQGATSWLLIVIGVIAVTCAMINVAGGYLVTDRMLRMFKGKEGSKK